MDVRRDWDNFLWNEANNNMAQSLVESERDNMGKSWALSGMARLCYLAHAVATLVMIPFAILAAIFGLAHAVVTWNHKSEYLGKYASILLEKLDQFCLSLFGAIGSPTLSYKGRDIHVFPYVAGGALGIAALFILPSPNYVAINTNGKMTMGWALK